MYEYHVSLFYDIPTEKYESIEFYSPDVIVQRLVIDISSFSNYCIERYLLPIAYSEITMDISGKKRKIFIKNFDHLSIQSFYKVIHDFIQSLPNMDDDEEKPTVELLQLGSILGNTNSEDLIANLLAYYKETNHG